MRKGFTIVEFLVSATLFITIMAIAVGGFSRALHTQREVSVLLSAQSNASLALEQMAREMRTGYLFCDASNTAYLASHPTADPSSWADASCGCTYADGPGEPWTCEALSFYNANGEPVNYAVNNGAITRTDNGAQSLLTGADVHIDAMNFTLFGNLEGDGFPPRVTIGLQISPSSSDPAVASDTINLQTTVSARAMDCTPGPTSTSC